MTDAHAHEQDFTPEEHLTGDLLSLGMAWQELGIDPDAFLRCAVCHEYMIDSDGTVVDCKCEREKETP
jgi:hypothetical protein